MATESAGTAPTTITFDLPEEEARALERLAGTRKVRLTGQIRKGKLVVDSASFAEEGRHFPGTNSVFVAVNAPFKKKQALASV